MSQNLRTVFPLPQTSSVPTSGTSIARAKSLSKNLNHFSHLSPLGSPTHPFVSSTMASSAFSHLDTWNSFQGSFPLSLTWPFRSIFPHSRPSDLSRTHTCAQSSRTGKLTVIPSCLEEMSRPLRNGVTAEAFCCLSPGCSRLLPPGGVHAPSTAAPLDLTSSL